MPAVTLPGMNLQGGWSPGESGWGPAMNDNLFKLSVMVQARVLSRSTALPGSPGPTDIYIVPPGSAESDMIAAWDDEAQDWVYYPPTAGTEVFVADESLYIYWEGSTWRTRPIGDTTILAKSADYTVAAGDFFGATIILMNTDGGNRTITIPEDLSVTEPLTVIRAGSERLTITGGGGVILRAADNTYTLRTPWAGAQIVPIGPDEYVLIGDLGA